MDKYVLNNKPQKTEAAKSGNPFMKFLYFVFVKNFGYKLLAVVLSLAVFLLTVGLG